MRVLFLTNIPSPYRVDFFNRLGRHCELTVWFEAANEANREWQVDGLGRHFRYKFLPGRTFGLDKHLNPSILRELETQPFDVYILGCYSSPTEMIAIHWLKLRRKPFILNSDGGFPGDERWLLRKLKTYLISSASLWLSSGSQCTRYLQHYGAEVSRIREYPLAAAELPAGASHPLSPADKAQFKAQHRLGGVTLLAVGQFIPRKGFDVLIRAFGKLQREMGAPSAVSLLLVGGGPEKTRYAQMIREARLSNVILLDFMQQQELVAYWQAADIFVLPTRYDVWGLVLNEAAAFGLPIVTTTRAGAAHDLVRDGENGFVVPPDDEDALVRSCLQLVRDSGLRERFGRRSRELAAQYSLDRMVERHLHILQEWKGVQVR